MDILVRLKDLIVDLIFNLPVSITTVILRMGFLLVLFAVLLRIAWLYLPSRTVFSQVCVAFLAIIIALNIPFEEFRGNDKGLLAFSVVFSILCMIFLPNKIVFWLTPRLGDQVKLGQIIKYLVWLVFIIQIIIW